MTEETFKQQLVNVKTVESISDKLCREKLPLILWGSGDVAGAVYKTLKKDGIEIDNILVDGIIGNNLKFHEIDIIDRSQLIKKYEKFNIIFGHSCYYMGKTLKKELPQVNKIFYPHDIGYGLDKDTKTKIYSNIDKYVSLCEVLADEISIKNLIAYLNTELTQDEHYILDVFDKPVSFFNNDIFKMESDEVFLDIGACDGDTLKMFLNETKMKYKKIIAVEAGDDNFQNLSNYVSEKKLRNVILSKIGAWNKTEDLILKDDGAAQRFSIEKKVANNARLINSKDIIVHGERLDCIFDKEEISFIKINYKEGLLETLEGCREILCDSRPKLSITVGFDVNHPIKIVEFIKSLNLGYSFYLRFNRGPAITFTLYAKVPEIKN